MPNIHEYSQQTSAPGAIEQRRASAADFGGDGGFNEMGQNIAHIGGQIQDKLEKDDVFEAEKKASKESTDLEKWLQDEKLNAPVGAKGFTEKVSAELEKRKQKIFDGYSGGTEKGKQALELRLNSLYQNAQQDSIHFEAQSAGLAQKEDLKTQLNENANVVRADPTKLAKILESQTALVGSVPNIDNQTRNQIQKDFSTTLYDSSLDGTVTNLESSHRTTIGDINREIAALKDDKSIYRAHASKEQYDRSLTRLQMHKEKLGRQNEQIIEINFHDEMNQMKMKGKDFGKFSKSWINENVQDPGRRAVMLKERDTAEEVARQTAFVKVSSDSDVIKKLNELNPGNQKDYSASFGKDYKAFDALRDAFALRQAQMKEDPAGYAREADDSARTSHEQFLKTGSPVDAAHYADMVILAQKKFNPDAVPQILSKQEIGQFKARIDAIGTDPKGAQAVTNEIQKMQHLWGSNWKYAARDLRINHAMSDELYVVGSMMDDPRNKPLADDLVRASTFKAGELTKSIDDKNVAKSAQLAAREALSDFKQSFPEKGGGFKTYEAFEDSLAKLLIYKTAVSGENMDKVAGQYASQIVTGKYNFEDTYRIPKYMGPSPVDPKLVKNGAEFLKKSVDTLPLIAPRSGLRPADAIERYRSSVKRTGLLVNTPDESGLMLLDEMGAPVMVEDRGQRKSLSWTWAQIQSAGTAAPPRHMLTLGGG